MKERFSCIDGIDELKDVCSGEPFSILLPGLSVQNVDRSKLDQTKTISCNDLLRVFDVDFYVLRDPDRLASVFTFFASRSKTTAIFSESVIQRLRNEPPIDYRFGKYADEEVNRLAGVFVESDLEEVLPVYLIDLAFYLGASTVDLYGYDFCSTLEKTHAFNLKKSKSKNGKMISKSVFSTDRWLAKKAEVENHSSRWDKSKIVNRSRVSILDCFRKEDFDE